MVVVGGTASVLGGGKFANGAMSGAFVHLFNAEISLDKEIEILQNRWSALDQLRSNLGLMGDAEIEAMMIKIYQDEINNMNRWLSVHEVSDKGYLQIQQQVIDLKVEAAMAVRMYHATGIVVYKNRKGKWVVPK